MSSAAKWHSFNGVKFRLIQYHCRHNIPGIVVSFGIYFPVNVTASKISVTYNILTWYHSQFYFIWKSFPSYRLTKVNSVMSFTHWMESQRAFEVLERFIQPMTSYDKIRIVCSRGPTIKCDRHIRDIMDQFTNFGPWHLTKCITVPLSSRARGKFEVGIKSIDKHHKSRLFNQGYRMNHEPKIPSESVPIFVVATQLGVQALFFLFHGFSHKRQMTKKIPQKTWQKIH